VTLRAQRLLPSLRTDRLFGAVRGGLAAGSRGGLRILEFSVQSNHLHLIVEADDGRALSRGIQGLAIRLAKAVNRILGRRGRVWGDRYHVRALKTPSEVRNALIYVLQNWRKHLPGFRGFDPCSSALWKSSVGKRKARKWETKTELYPVDPRTVTAHAGTLVLNDRVTDLPRGVRSRPAAAPSPERGPTLASFGSSPSAGTTTSAGAPSRPTA